MEIKEVPAEINEARVRTSRWPGLTLGSGTSLISMRPERAF